MKEIIKSIKAYIRLYGSLNHFLSEEPQRTPEPDRNVKAENKMKVKTLKEIGKEHSCPQCKAVDKPKCVEYNCLQQAAQEWKDHFKSGELWTDYAADQRKGQENIIEWIDTFFDLEKETDDEMKKEKGMSADASHP